MTLQQTPLRTIDRDAPDCALREGEQASPVPATSMTARARALRQQGMTLIEIMIVVVIMALVATGVGMAVLPALEKSKITSTRTAIQTVRSAVTLYIATNNAECATMDQLIEDKAIDKSTSTRDPWDHEFLIECDGSEVTVRSAGPDGEFGNEDDIPKVGDDG